ARRGVRSMRIRPEAHERGIEEAVPVLRRRGVAMKAVQSTALVLLALLLASPPAAHSADGATRARKGGVFSRDNLVAWCIVPFDAKHRGPKDRADMLVRLGIKRVAYDWRDQHIPE